MFASLNISRWSRYFALGALWAGTSGLAVAQPPAIPDGPAGPEILQADAKPALAADPDEGMQVLEEGPIHEAFAEPIALDAAPRVTVDRQPPEPINELPPEVRPEGANVEWIPGYWMWFDERQDFVWVSGVWRDVPPGRRWVPGHWVSEGGSFQWVGGFWADEKVKEVQMLPTPPTTLEVGPSSPAPGDNYFWVPGCWIYGNSGYSWRTGYWYAGQQNWMWVPDHYNYTPYGSIFVNGYWDYGLANRGLLYAPVYWNRPVYGNVGWYYRPRSVVNTALLLTSLFVNRGHNHYYYGYGNWRNNGYTPWWNYGSNFGHHHYDPIFAYHRWHDGRNRNDWVDRYRRDFDRHRQDHLEHRDGRDGRNRVDADRLVRNIEDVRRNNDLQVRLRQMSDAEQQATRRHVERVREIRDARVQGERTVGSLSLGRVDASGDAAARARVGERENRGDRNRGDQPTAGAEARTRADAARTGENRGSRLAAEGNATARTGADGERSFQGRSVFKLPPSDRAAGQPGSAATGGRGQGSQNATTGPGSLIDRAAGRSEGQSRDARARAAVENRASGFRRSVGDARTSQPSQSQQPSIIQRRDTGPQQGAAQQATPRAYSPRQRDPSTSGNQGGQPQFRNRSSAQPTGPQIQQRSSGGSSMRVPSSDSPAIRGSSSSQPSPRSFRSAPSSSSRSPSASSSSGRGFSSAIQGRSSGSSSSRSFSPSRGSSQPSAQSRSSSGESRSFNRSSGGGSQRASSSRSSGGSERGNRGRGRGR